MADWAGGGGGGNHCAWPQSAGRWKEVGRELPSRGRDVGFLFFSSYDGPRGMRTYPVRGGWGGAQFVHGRSRMTVDPRIPTVPGRSMSGFHQPGRHCLHQARSAVRCSASRMEGELHPSKSRSAAHKTDFGTLCLLSCLWLTASMRSTLFYGVATSETAMNGYYYVTASWVPYHIHTT